MYSRSSYFHRIVVIWIPIIFQIYINDVAHNIAMIPCQHPREMAQFRNLNCNYYNLCVDFFAIWKYISQNALHNYELYRLHCLEWSSLYLTDMILLRQLILFHKFIYCRWCSFAHLIYKHFIHFNLFYISICLKRHAWLNNVSVNVYVLGYSLMGLFCKKKV